MEPLKFVETPKGGRPNEVDISSTAELQGYAKGLLSSVTKVTLSMAKYNDREMERLYNLLLPVVTRLNEGSKGRIIVLRYTAKSDAAKFGIAGGIVGAVIGGGAGYGLLAAGAITGPVGWVVVGGVVIGAIVIGGIAAVLGSQNKEKVIVLTIDEKNGTLTKEHIDREQFNIVTHEKA
jgi:hypothetical protein